MGARAAATALAAGAAAAAALLAARRRLAAGAAAAGAAAAGAAPRVLVGVDVGGTAIKAALVRVQGGELVAALEEPVVDHTFDGVCRQVARIVRTMEEHPDAPAAVSLEGVGVCVPGLVDAASGQVLAAANFPTWPRPAPFARRIGELLGKEPQIDNDANAALCAETWVGAARGEEDVVLLTLGTGIGSAILSGGRLIHGATNSAGELGHTILVPNGDRFSEKTGVRGIFEDYASARAVAETARAAVARGDCPDSALHSAVACGEESLCQRVFELAAAKDPLAARIVKETGEYLGIASINIVRSYDPAVIVFGGGMTRAGELLLSAIRAGFNKHYWTLSKPTCRLTLTSLGGTAGAIGAAFLAHPQRDSFGQAEQ